MKKFNLVVTGGTFDHLHKGHKEFLIHIFSLSKDVLIGLTSDSFARKKESEILSYKTRKKELEEFLAKQDFLQRVKIEKINSVFIPSVWNTLPIEAIVVTEETIKGAQIINDDRIKKRLPPFNIISFPLTHAQDGLPISSTRVRQGIIDREGFLYIPKEWNLKNFFLTQELREELKNPFGQLITSFDMWAKKHHDIDYRKVISVGDVVTKTCNEYHLKQKISAVDFRVLRQDIYSSVAQLGFGKDVHIIHVENPPGTITYSLLSAAQDVVKKNGEKNAQYVLVVKGEEDLAVMAFLLAAPLGYTVLYGQPRKGVVRVIVDEETKNKARFIMRKCVQR